MAEIKSPSVLTQLSELSTLKLQHDSNIFKILSKSQHIFSKILPFSRPQQLEFFFDSQHFQSHEYIQTFYGKIKCCLISKVLMKMLCKRNALLRHHCILKLIQLSPTVFNVESVINLPLTLFKELITFNFVVYWLPMTHVLYHNDKNSRSNFDVVFNLLSDLRIFERLYDSYKDLQLFIHSWMQHSHFYSTFTNGIISVIPHPEKGKFDPLVPPHELSHMLVENLKSLLESKFRNSTTKLSISSLSKSINVCLKVGYFLNESSEYEYGFQAGRAILTTVQSISAIQDIPKHISMKWEYEAICIMLRSMNSQSMYLEEEHREIFYQTAPTILKRIRSFGLNIKLIGQCRSQITENYLLASLPTKLKVSMRLSSMRKGLENLHLSYGNLINSGSSVNNNDEILSFSTSYLFDDLPITSSSDESNLNDLNNYDNSFNARIGSLIGPEISDMITETPLEIPTLPISTAFLHAQLAIFYYSMCNYRVAFQFTMLAIDELITIINNDNPIYDLHPSVIVEVLRISCRVCIIQRKYSLGMRIIRLTNNYARQKLGCHNVTYANLLLEYGCLLLNTDETRKASEMYRLGLSIITDCLPGSSIMAALALEDIAYAYYVLEYSSGDFAYALKCADVAGQLLKRLNSEVCMQAASANRVKALILEEIAIDDSDSNRTKAYLYIARDLHMQSLDLCERTFGLCNIQTAKHFGNLGRLFQSMELNESAEKMHLKAIKIKERLLGPNDFEVGLSVGHLASLYNYHMNRYQEAEVLYLRSIKISLTLFGPTYSGLEFDYRGLQRVYRKLGDADKLQQYHGLFDEWNIQRQNIRFQDEIENKHIELYSDRESLLQIFDEYHNAFTNILGYISHSSKSSTSSPIADTSPRSQSPVLSSETSRSTGY